MVKELKIEPPEILVSCDVVHLYLRSALRSWSIIYDGGFSENSYLLKAIDCFRKKLNLRCSNGF